MGFVRKIGHGRLTWESQIKNFFFKKTQTFEFRQTASTAELRDCNFVRESAAATFRFVSFRASDPIRLDFFAEKKLAMLASATMALGFHQVGLATAETAF